MSKKEDKQELVPVTPKQLPIVSPEEKSRCLESSLFNLTQAENGIPFIGTILQCMNISYSSFLPTAGVAFDAKSKTFKMYINPNFFCQVLSADERVAVLTHEIYHITNKHVFFSCLQDPKDADNPSIFKINKQRMNIAMDLVINQTIKNLPKMGMFIEHFKDEKGKAFPKNSTTEMYYKLLTDDATMTKDLSGEGKDGDGNPIPGQGEPDGRWTKNKDGTHSIKVKDMIKEDEFDSHDGWGDGDEKDKLEAMRDLIKRAKQKNSTGYDLSQGIRDLLEECEGAIRKLDYKAILLSALKRSMPSKDVTNTWRRPSRRYGDIAPGKKLGTQPKIEVFMDTSGSISVEEANQFLNITNNFMINGASKCTLNYFHSNLYHTEKVKKNQKVDVSKIQSGGTDLTEVFKRIIKNKADLNIILTDGYFGEVDIPAGQLKNLSKIVFVINKQGTDQHPLKKFGKTYRYE